MSHRNLTTIEKSDGATHVGRKGECCSSAESVCIEKENDNDRIRSEAVAPYGIDSLTQIVDATDETLDVRQAHGVENQTNNETGPTVCRQTHARAVKGTDVTKINGLRELWNETLGDPRVCIAILDGPVDLSQSAFAESKLQTTGGRPAVDSATMHGTHIASIIFGSHQSSVKGIAPQCSGIVVPIYRSRDDGTVEPCSQANLAKAIHRAVDYATEANAETLVINISGGQFSESGEADASLSQAIERCEAEGVLVVAAAGNEGCECLHVPGALPSVLVVGAMSNDGEPLEFSNWGQKYANQGVLALGENIVGASPLGTTSLKSGTSFATPIVSGVAALLLSMQLKSGVRPSSADVRKAIVMSALGCDSQMAKDCRRLLAGRLSITHAIKTLTSGEQNKMNDPQYVDKPSETDSTSAGFFGESPVVPSQFDEAESPTKNAIVSSPVETQPEVIPSGCECGGQSTVTPVYAIGSLTFDFASVGVRNGLQDRMKSLLPAEPLPESEKQLLQHLFQVNSDGIGKDELNIPEARRVTWILEHAGVPQYAIAPAADYDLAALVFDFAEQSGMADGNQNTLLGNKKVLPNDLRPTHFGVAGYATGKFVSVTGTDRPLEILVPEYDLTDSWNVGAIIEEAKKEGLIGGDDESAERRFIRTVRQLHAQISPKGKTAQTRAINFMIAHSALLAQESLVNQYRDGFVFVGISAVGDLDTKRDADRAVQITARYIDVNDQRNIPYEQNIRINVANPKPYYEGATEIGFGDILSAQL